MGTDEKTRGAAGAALTLLGVSKVNGITNAAALNSIFLITCVVLILLTHWREALDKYTSILVTDSSIGRVC